MPPRFKNQPADRVSTNNGLALRLSSGDDENQLILDVAAAVLLFYRDGKVLLSSPWES